MQEGNQLLEAELWAEPGVELMTRQPSGCALDRYGILEATHLHRAKATAAGDGNEVHVPI